MKKIIICLFAISTAIGQNKKTAQASGISKTIFAAETREITITEENNFEIDFSKVANFSQKSLKFKSGTYIVTVNRENPFGKVTLDLADGADVKPFHSSRLNCTLRGGKNCDTSGFSCLVITLGTAMSVEPVIENNRVKKLLFVFLTPDFLSVWEDPNNPKGGCVNLNNPFDYKGKLHNERLNQIAQTAEYVQLKKNYAGNSEAIKNYLTVMEKTLTNKEVLKAQKKNSSNRVEALQKMFNASAAFNDYFSKLTQMIALVLKDQTVTAGEYQLFFSAENSILKDKLLNATDKQNILSTYATARYSIFYWESMRRHSYNPIELPGPTPMAKGIDWGEVSGVDAICALAGPEAAPIGSLINVLLQAANSR